MNALQAEEDRRLAERAARYLVQQHGENAVAEAEAALRHATELDDKSSIDSLVGILNALRGTTLT